MRFECVADIGMNSVLAEYHRELLKQYDLLFVDSSYCGSHPDIANAEGHLRSYMQKNLRSGEGNGIFSGRDLLAMDVGSAGITEYSVATDENCAVLKRQATDYLNDYPLGAVLDKIAGNAGALQGFSLDTTDVGAMRSGYESEIDAIGLPEVEVEEGVFEEVPLNNPADAVNAVRGSGVLNLVLEDPSAVSAVKIDPGAYFSHRSGRMTGTGLCAEAAEVGGEADELVFQAYLFEKCGYYGAELEKALMKYQIEYILMGKDTDWQNLEEVAKRLLRWREAANVLYILTDSAKVAEAQAMAAALSAVILLPALTEPVKYTILFAWAYVESLQDVKTLFNGGRVPIWKTAADWKTGINCIKDVRGSLAADGGGSGLNYKEYLQIMLFLQSAGTRGERAVDVMEMDIRKTPGNAQFRMDACFDSFSAQMSVNSRFGYSYEMTRRYGFY
ncbi:MAG: DUF5702 domain-containing protein [Bacteroidales bacterium]|nr:DUF5702 domain-containing protein [Bacteroidales bacterium]MCM1415570.1 DUF5702 domain-containing protein [bacterium]MCM1424098.1 DUF5702 domain-containing protein [bacterium]